MGLRLKFSTRSSKTSQACMFAARRWEVHDGCSQYILDLVLFLETNELQFILGQAFSSLLRDNIYYFKPMTEPENSNRIQVWHDLNPNCKAQQFSSDLGAPTWGCSSEPVMHLVRDARTVVSCFYKSRVLDVVREHGCTMSHNAESGTMVGLHKVLRVHVQQFCNAEIK